MPLEVAGFGVVLKIKTVLKISSGRKFELFVRCNLAGFVGSPPRANNSGIVVGAVFGSAVFIRPRRWFWVFALS